LAQRSLAFERQLNVPLSYKGNSLNSNLRIDLLVEKTVAGLRELEGNLRALRAFVVTFTSRTCGA
jgi:hypothetical protein